MIEHILKVHGKIRTVDIEAIDEEIDADLADMVTLDFPFRKVKEIKMAGDASAQLVYVRNLMGQWFSFAYDPKKNILQYSEQHLVSKGWRIKWSNKGIGNQ